MSVFTFSIEDYILYILNKLEPEKSDKLKLNKVAFFVEFAYLFFRRKILSQADYAAINRGPAIDDYKVILQSMAKKGKVKLDGYKVRPLTNPSNEPPEEIANFIDPLIDKYSELTNNELIALSHQTDPWLITTNNNKNMGMIIDKDLASLESFFVEESSDESQDEIELPKVDKESLEEYEFD